MSLRQLLAACVLAMLPGTEAIAVGNELADAAMKQNRDSVRALLKRKADVNAPQLDGTTALHWAVRFDDLETADLLILAGANASAANREGVTPLQLAALNGNAAMIDKLLKAGANPNAPLTPSGDTALMMASRTGKPDAITVLLEGGAGVNARESWGGTTALMWAVAEQHAAAVKVLIDHGADVNARSNFVPAANGRGFEGRTPAAPRSDQKVEEFASGWLTPLMLAAREGDVESARLLLAAGADVNAIAGDGKDALGLAIFNGNYELASFLIDNKSNVNQADAQGFTPLFWAVDRRNMETAPNFPWMVTTDPLPLIKKLLDTGANPNALVNNTPRARMRAGSPRIVFATSLMRAAFSADLELVKLLLSHGADARAISKDGETMVEAAAGLGFIQGYSKGRSEAERLAVVKLFVELGADVNQADDYGIIEHVPDARLYLQECRRVLRTGGRCYLSTAPYLSFAGAHLPRLRIPVPLHLLVGRAAAFRIFRMLARSAPWTLKEPAHENSFIRDAQRGIAKEDDLLEKVRVERLRGQIAQAGLRVLREELHVTGTVRRLPATIGRWLRDSALTQDVLISNIEYVLEPK